MTSRHITYNHKTKSVLQLRDELLLKILFGSFASPGDLVTNLKKSIAEHELRLLNYHQNLQYIPTRGERIQEGRRHNPYTEADEGDPFFRLIARFAIEFENTYLRWLYETLAFLAEKESSRKPS